MTIEFIDHHHHFLPSVKQLGTKSSATLGFMPDGGFNDHAEKKCIIVAHDNDVFAGYLMFRVTSKQSKISIVHLCVKDDFRGKNVSTLLLDALRDKFNGTTFRGISLNCRRDFEYASKVWERYGFIVKNDKRSRSIEEKYLDNWWYDFNATDLFSMANQASVKLKVLLDANIIIKLRDANVVYEPSQDPRPLLADWLIGEIDYYYAPEIHNEIIRDKNKVRVKQTRSFLTHFIEAKHNIEERKLIASQLESILIGNSDNDRSDRNQLATAISAETSYFITFDKEILEKRAKIEELFDIQVLTPQELIVEFDQLVNKNDYSPTRLAGVVFNTISKVSTDELDKQIDFFLNKAQSENKQRFKNIVYRGIEDIEKRKIKSIKKNEHTIAFFGYEYGDVLRISFMRLAETKEKNTLFMHLISDFINKAIKRHVCKIEFHEYFLSESQEVILNQMGFDKESNVWTKNILSEMRHSTSLNELPHLHPSISNLHLLPKKEKESFLTQLERKLFPLKITDLELPCYIIPIKAHWASQLFDLQSASTTLFGAPEDKIWNYENVYYRSTAPITEKAPARILWYVSDDENFQRSKAIVATSYLDEVITGKPKELFRQNKRYGIYEWWNIYELCKKDINNDIRALRFSGTELFYRIIPLSEVQGIFSKYGKRPNTFPSPVLVGNNIFNHIYLLGANRGNR